MSRRCSRNLKHFFFLCLFFLSSCTTIVSTEEFDAIESPEINITTPTPDASFSENDRSVLFGFDNPRPKYHPGQLVDYTAQSGDTIPALASRFNTTNQEIMRANPEIPADVTTLPQGFPMQIPIYYRSNWGSSFQILPDGLFVFSSEQIGFSARVFTDRAPGWFKYFSVYTGEKNRRGGEIIDYIAETYSLSPRLLLAILDYQTGALSQEKMPEDINHASSLGFSGYKYEALSSQLNQLANFLNNTYYRYREGELLEFEMMDGGQFRIDPWQNAATAAIQAYFGNVLPKEDFLKAIAPDGFTRHYKILFGDFPPVDTYPPNIPGSLRQTEMRLPFQDGKPWTYTGGPHAAWGSGQPYAAIDFAPPSVSSGCVYSNEWVTVPADGFIIRTDVGTAVFDLDGDQDERTGWNILFLHLLTESIPPVGTKLAAGDVIGHPSCDGGTATGTHIHMARKYNGEWISAGGVIPFNLDGWIVGNGTEAYLGTMTRYSRQIIASEKSNYNSIISRGTPDSQTPSSK